MNWLATTHRRLKLTRTFMALAGILLSIAACDSDTRREIEAMASEASGAISDLTLKGDTGVIDGEPDYGINVKFTVTNNGEDGILTLTTRLSTSEGEWSRQQKLSFSAGQSMTLSYFFHEPTINATNVQGRVNVFPQSQEKS